jgi:phosphate transport system permease protein
MRAMLLAGTIVALVPLILIVYYLLKEGLGSIDGAFFTQDPTGSYLGAIGGVRSAIVGSIEIVMIASLFGIPAGLGVALYLTEYGGGSRLANLVRSFVDVLTGVPSIVFGLFIYTTLVLAHVGGNFTAWKASIALAMLMLPIVVRSAEVVLALVPDGLREAALALGAPRWRVIVRVVLPTALPGLLTGSLLAIARAMGETAPLLFTTAGANGLTLDPGQQMNALPLQIYNDVLSPRQVVVSQAWGAGLILVVLVLLINLTARSVARRRRVA